MNCLIFKLLALNVNYPEMCNLKFQCDSERDSYKTFYHKHLHLSNLIFVIVFEINIYLVNNILIGIRDFHFHTKN